MRTFPIFISIIVILTSCKKPKVDCTDLEIIAPKVILVAGQSNTHAGLGLDASIDAPEDGIYQLGRFSNDMCIIQACEPLDHHTRTDDRIGFALTFAKLLKLHQEGSGDILIVPSGFGGTGFIDNHWNKGNDLYQDAVMRVNHVLTKYPDAVLSAVLWHQGETDIFLQNPDYQASLDQFINDLRTDIGHPEVPLIVGGMVPYWVDQETERQAVQAIIASTPQRHLNVGYADPTVPFVIQKPDNTFDEIHFNAEGQRELGQRYFAEYLEIVE
ncbi:MAG: sialate O-acetylesterase [Flavobacteriales bacterium]|nr:sialate O-acetylesterase [Flavobacteriales bacterium]MCB9190416.1 sialate O-acetylesterase [Flavobacteriales bacterium]MCB9204665.1 sialate O-acetylesterase [Flavobacteriales bacterium]